MTADLMIPILFIVVMFIIISVMEEPLLLLLIGFLFVPVSFLFAVSIDNYDYLFTASIVAFKGSVYYTAMFQGIMFTVPAMAFLRMIYVKKGFDEAV